MTALENLIEAATPEKPGNEGVTHAPSLYCDNALVGAGSTPARFREGIKPSATFSCAGVYETIKS